MILSMTLPDHFLHKADNMEIELTTHICERYIERFNQNLNAVKDFNARLIMAKKAIMVILADARYVSDDERGILLRSKTYSCNLIVHKRRLITIYPLDRKAKERERKHSE